MQTRRQRRRGGKSAQAVSSDPPVRPPSPASESTVESEEESEAELADLEATGVRDRDPPTTTMPGDAYQTPPAGAGIGPEGAQAEAPPSTTGDDLSGPDLEGIDLAEALATAEAPDPDVGPSDTQVVEAPSHMRVEPAESIETTNPHTLDLDTTHSQVQVETQTHTLDTVTDTADTQTLTLIPQARTLTHITVPRYL